MASETARRAEERGARVVDVRPLSVNPSIIPPVILTMELQDEFDPLLDIRLRNHGLPDFPLEAITISGGD